MKAARAWAILSLLAVVGSGARVRAEGSSPSNLADLGSESVERRRAAAESLSSPGSTTPATVEELARELSQQHGDDEDVASLLRALHHPAHDVDLMELLIEQKPDPTVERALAVVCCMRALAKIGTTPAVRYLVSLSTGAASGGPLRAELSRELKQLDERAAAALIEARGDRSPDVRAWAKDTLDTIGKRSPGDAVQTTDDQVLVDVLHAYAGLRDPDAVPVVLSFVNSDRPQVRAAARDATLAYGKEASAKVHATYAALTGDHLPDDSDPAEAAHKLFDAYDRHRLRDVYALLDEGLGKEDAGDVAGAVADFDAVLARQPMLDRRAAMAAAYASRAAALESTDRPRAVDYLEEAIRLDEDGSDRDRWRSEVAYLQGQELASRGVADSSYYDKALALDAHNERARAALNLMAGDTRIKRARENWMALAVASTGILLLAVGTSALIVLGRRRAAPLKPARSSPLQQ